MQKDGQNSRVVRFGVFEADLLTRELRKRGVRVRLQEQPFRLLQALLERPGQIVTREEIKEKLWPEDTFVDFDKSLNTAAQKLRQALGDSADSPRFMETIPPQGYRFLAPVGADDGPSVAAIAVGEAPRKSRHAQMLLVFLAGCVVATSAVWFFAGEADEREALSPTYDFKRITYDAGLNFEPSISRDGKMVAYASDRAGDDNLDIWVQQVAGGNAIQLTSDPASEREPSFSPDGSLVAFRSEADGAIYVVPALGGEPRFLAAAGRRPRFSPDGTLVAYWSGRSGTSSNRGGPSYGVHVVPADGGVPRLLGEGRSPVWSPDGGRVLAANRTAGQSEWVIFSLSGEEEATVTAIGALGDSGLSTVVRVERSFLPVVPQQWLDDDSVLVTAWSGDSENLWTVPLFPESGGAKRQVARVTAGGSSERHAAVAGTGAIVFSSVRSNSDIWTIDIESNTGVLKGLPERVTASLAADFSPHLAMDGQRVVFRSRRSGNLDIWVKDLKMERLFQITATDVDEGGTAIHPSADRVAYRGVLSFNDDPASIYWSQVDGGPRHRFPSANNSSVSDWSMDGRNLLLAQVELLDVKTGDVRELLGGETSWSPRFSPDARWTVFHRQVGPDNRQVFVTPIPEQGQLSDEDLIPITDGKQNDFRAAWSPNGALIYFGSDRDGYRCIYAQPVNRETKRPEGAVKEVFHSHGARLAMSNISSVGFVGVSVARDKMAIAMGELAGDIWIMEPRDAE